jgi:hypothetical protein
VTLDDPQQPCRRHTWQPTPGADPDGPPAGYACTDCPATATPCSTCRKPLEHATARTCPDCVSDARNTVRDIRDLYAQLPDVIASVAGLHAVRYDRGGGKGRASDTSIIGGAAFVLAGPGNADKSRLGPHEDPRSEVIQALMAAERNDPPSVLGVLTFWEDAWRDEQHQHAAATTTVAATVEYLVVHTTWAAQHSPTWDEYVRDTRSLRRRLRILTGDDRRPVKAGVPCPYCAGTIVQHWRDVDPKKPGSGGLEDVRRCNVCGLTWASEAHFRMALREAHAELPDRRPEELVTLDDAKRIFKERGVRPNLLDLWAHRDRRELEDYEHGRRLTPPTPRLPAARGRDVRGVLLYRLGDLAERLTPMEGSAS